VAASVVVGIIVVLNVVLIGQTLGFAI